MSTPLDILTFPLSGLRLIEASAGTGKTYTIAGLYLRLLLGHGTAESGFGAPLPVDRILVVTFTEAATAELRERILKAIRQLRRAIETGETRDKLHRALMESCADHRDLALKQLLTAERQIDEAAIFTIHGFCQRMLTQNAFESGSLFDNEFLTEEQQLRAQTVADFWRQITWQAEVTLAEGLLKHWKGPADLLRDLSAQLALPDITCRVRTTETLAERHQAIVQRLDGLRRTWLQTDLAALQALIADSDLKKQSYRQDYVAKWVETITAWASTPQQGYAFPEKELQRFSTADMAEKSKSGTAPSHPLFRLIDTLLAEPGDIDDIVLAQALTAIRERLQKQKQRKQQLSFDDLLANLARALKSERGQALAEQIRELYPVAMIDEFQDTDPLQYQIFATLYERNPECGFYMIGDPKQAIYAFRGADIFTYMHAKQQVKAHYTLQTNFRSTTELVAGVNALFAQSAAPFIYQHSIPFEAVHANGKDEGFVLLQRPQPALQCCFPLAGQGPVIGGEYQTTMAKAAAAQIHQWLTCAQSQQATLDGKVVRPNDIAVLVRSGYEARLMQQALSACGIASVYLSNRESVFAQPVAQDIARLMEACLNLQDDMLIRSAMATTLMGWTVSQLAQLNDDETLWEDTVERMRIAAGIWQQRGILPMLRQWLFWYQIPERLLNQTQGERMLTDVLHIGELLQTAANTLNGEHALLRWLLDRCESPNGDTDEQQLRLDSERQRVQIVTIHKSKGLQYGLVLLPFICAYRANAIARYHTDDQGVVWDLSEQDASWERAAEERLAEDLRLLYVALTRGIYVTWLGLADLKIAKKGKDDRPAALDYLFADDTATPLTSRLQRWIHQHNRLDEVCEVDSLPYPEVRYQPLAENTPVLQARRFTGTIERNWRVTSYSALTVQHATAPHNSSAKNSSEEGPAIEGPVIESLPAASADTAEPGIVTPAEPTAPVYDVYHFPKGARAGTFLHSLLEDLDFRSDADTRRQWIEQHLQGVQLCRDWQAEHWFPTLEGWLTQMLHSELFPGLSLAMLAPSQCLSEMEFFLPLSTMSAGALNRCLVAGDPLSARAAPLSFQEVQGMLKGFIDLVFEQDGRFYVVDYKSNYLGDQPQAYTREAMAEAMIEHRYDVQYQLYTLALHRYLKTRIPGYDYDRQFGGVCYLFLRGMTGETGSGVYATKPERAHIERLDRLFAGEEVTV